MRRKMKEKSNLFLLNRFKYFDDAFLFICRVNSLKNLAVLSPSNFPNYLVIILLPAVNTQTNNTWNKLKNKIK